MVKRSVTQWRGLDPTVRLAQKGDAKAAGALFQGGRHFHFMQPMSDRSREPIMAAQGVGNLGPDAARTAASSAGRSLRCSLRVEVLSSIRRQELAGQELIGLRPRSQFNFCHFCSYRSILSRTKPSMSGLSENHLFAARCADAAPAPQCNDWDETKHIKAGRTVTKAVACRRLA